MTRTKGVAAALVVLAIITIAPSVLAADPSTSPQPPTCAERYPGDGPAQVDLRLGCIANEIVGHYTNRQAVEPVPLSTYLGPLVAVVGGFALLAVVVRFALGRASKRLAPASPGAYWLCPECRSVNDPTRASCYSCGHPWSAEAAIVPVDERPEMAQRFGGDRKSGPS